MQQSSFKKSSSRVQGRATTSSATKELSKLFKQVDELLNDRLDALAVQFKESQPAFWHAYNTARVIVDSTGGRASKDTAPTAKAA